MTSPMYKGGWWLCVKHKIPTETIEPTAEELARYDTLRAEYDRQKAESERLFKHMKSLVKASGLNLRTQDGYCDEGDDLDGYEDENPIFPSVEEPRKPTARVVERPKTPLDRATKKYLATGEEQYLLKAAALGAPIIYAFSGASMMGYDDPAKNAEAFRRDGPKIPDGIKVEGL